VEGSLSFSCHTSTISQINLSPIIAGRTVGVCQHICQDILPFGGHSVGCRTSPFTLRTMWRRYAVDFLKVFLKFIVRIWLFLTQRVRAMSNTSIQGHWVFLLDMPLKHKKRIKRRVSFGGRKTLVAQTKWAPPWPGIRWGTDKVL